MYMVMAVMKFGIDDTFCCEYSGIEHETKKDADIELKDAIQKLNNDNSFIYAYIKEDD